MSDIEVGQIWWGARQPLARVVVMVTSIGEDDAITFDTIICNSNLEYHTRYLQYHEYTYNFITDFTKVEDKNLEKVLRLMFI